MGDNTDKAAILRSPPATCSTADIVETRREKLCQLRRAVKEARYTFTAIGRSTDRSPSQISNIMRGNYPYYGANKLPKYLRVWFEEHRFQVDDALVTW